MKISCKSADVPNFHLLEFQLSKSRMGREVLKFPSDPVNKLVLLQIYILNKIARHFFVHHELKVHLPKTMALEMQLVQGH